ncbi:RDD family protein [Isoptericola sp. 4D.3]|uniref:RDD family protein n=1 Tax=Isoptericola peretonis TaxID=2918523 RepID=A0ABT0J3N7_9MICO|nr:RDD family protein [Isoptericola sp. 4D.3]
MTTTVQGPPPAVPPSGPAVSDAPGPFTPERPRAAWGNRALAVLLDSAVVASVAFLAAGDTSPFYSVPLHGVDDATTAGSPWAVGTLLALGVLQAYTGMTPGKRVAGIAVVDAGSGRPVGFLGTVLRWLAHVLDAVLFVGYLRAAFHREGRTFADSLLGTVAVRTATPVPHPWVARLRAYRDARIPGLRWPRRVTGAVALVLCSAAAAMILTTSQGVRTDGPATIACPAVPSDTFRAQARVEHTAASASRLWIQRPTGETWRVVAGWSWAASTGSPADVAPLDELSASVRLRSPTGLTLDAQGGTGELVDGDLFDADLGDVTTSVATEASHDVAGWTLHSVLTTDDGAVVAECTATVPTVP